MSKRIMILGLMALHVTSAFAGTVTPGTTKVASPLSPTASSPQPGDKVDTLPDVFQIKKVPSAKSNERVANTTQANPAPTDMPPLPNVPLSTKATKEEAFQALIDQELPMTPEQIVRLRKLIDDQQRAKSTLPNIPPKPVVSTMIVKGEPGETPPVLRLAKNFVTTIAFSDATGQPWPITSYGAGNDEMFTVSNADPKNSANILTISTPSAYAYGNLQVSLAGRPMPIMITLVSDQKSIDYLANVSVQARGPNATAPIVAGDNSNFKINPILTSFLDGIPPQKATSLAASDNRVQVWKLNDKYYVRTKMTLYSPAWSNHHTSPDGMQAYEISPTPVIVSGEDGKPQQIKIGE